MAQQTAVEWLIEQINGYAYPLSYNENIRIDIPKEVIEQAKEMEKEQIINAWAHGGADLLTSMSHPEQHTRRDAKQYYNETYNK